MLQLISQEGEKREEREEAVEGNEGSYEGRVGGKIDTRKLQAPGCRSRIEYHREN